MAISLVTIIVMGLLLYHRFKLALEKTAVDNTEATVEGTVDRLNADLLDIRQIFNGANYNVVQQFDISSREFVEQFSLLYETNSDKVQSVALYDHEGKLIASEPVALEKKNVQVQTQEWYKNAENAIENVHFSTPHIQELFEDGAYRYQWVVSLSSYVDVNKGEIPETGVLLLDMKYSVIRDVMKQINDSSDGIYYYLSSQSGEMIYHPRETELNRGLFKENSLEATKYENGTYEIRADGQNETVIVRSVAYTGWKMIGVVPESVQESNFKNFRYYVFATVLVLLVMLLEGNQLVSRKISKPIRELDASVKTYEAGGKPDIYIGGSSEIRHLGHSVQKSDEQIEELMDEIIRQQNERRKSELDALQSQINPHFLYNTLDTIIWLAESDEQKQVVHMVESLSENVMIPIAGMIISAILCYELITMVMDKNNMHEVGSEFFFRYLIKACIAVLLLSYTFDITMAIFDVGNHIVTRAGGIVSGSTTIDVTDTLKTMFDSQIDTMGIGELIGLGIETMIVSLCMKIISLLITVMLFGRMIEIYLYISVAPVPFATLSNREWGGIGNNYIKGLCSLAFQGFFIMVCVAIYAVLVSGIAVADNLHTALWSVAAYTVVLCFSLFKTGSLAKSIWNAH